MNINSLSQNIMNELLQGNCILCGKQLHFFEAIMKINGGISCFKCYMNSEKCYECNDFFYRKNMVEFRNFITCKDHSILFDKCYYCGKIDRKENMKEYSFCDNKEGFLCSHCQELEKICESCGKSTFYLHTIEISLGVFRNFCNPCRRMKSEICPCCSGNSDNNNDLYLCYSCQNNGMEECENCNSWTNRGLTETIDNEEICGRCLHNYFKCYSCGEYHKNNSGHGGNDLEGNMYCKDCYEYEEKHNPELFHDTCQYYDEYFIHPSCFKPIPIFNGGVKGKDIFLGIEIEYESKKAYCTPYVNDITEDYSPGERLFYHKEDGSLDSGAELVSNPCTLSFHQNDFPWEELCNDLREKNTSHNRSTCGIHIHITRDIFTKEEWKKIDFLSQKCKDELHIISRRSITSYYCNIEDKLEGGNFYTQKNSSNLGKNISDSRRYYAINFANEKTVEFRLFQSSLFHKTILSSLEFVHAFCLYGSIHSWEVLNKGFQGFLSWLNISNSNEYSYLKEYIYCRTIQECEEDEYIEI